MVNLEEITAKGIDPVLCEQFAIQMCNDPNVIHSTKASKQIIPGDFLVSTYMSQFPMRLGSLGFKFANPLTPNIPIKLERDKISSHLGDHVTIKHEPGRDTTRYTYDSGKCGRSRSVDIKPLSEVKRYVSVEDEQVLSLIQEYCQASGDIADDLYARERSNQLPFKVEDYAPVYAEGIIFLESLPQGRLEREVDSTTRIRAMGDSFLAQYNFPLTSAGKKMGSIAKKVMFVPRSKLNL